MDTGSGKTLIAVERIRAELLRGESDKTVWFITPAVALTYQQSDVIRRGLGDACKILALTGQEKVETWKNQRTWDDALHGVDVLVATYQVLADCLTHGFVKLYNISLLVVDEAHHCQKNEAPNRIMQNFYHVQKKERPDLCLPAILGLTASPVISQGIGSLR
jgi:ERCC4-related helicase